MDDKVAANKEAAKADVSPPRTQRVRDPVHGLITFPKNDKIAQLAWKLIDTKEFQRLRRIKQLGVSEFIYPGATHNRFIHSIGVFHVARQLLEIVRREIGAIGQEFDVDLAEVAVIAALLHDIGHGPFSHTFEGVQKARGVQKRHEAWSAEIIRSNEGSIFRILENFRTGLADEVADLLVLENPKNVYHAIVSSSFDADRLDYLRRDRQMTGTGAGAIDFDWLLDHVRVRSINLDAPDGTGDDESPKVPTFCIDVKALPAAEQFLLARYTLHEQVYFHKTTRCIEKMISALLARLAEIAKGDEAGIKIACGLDADHPLIRFFRSNAPSVSEYLELDDGTIFGSLERICLGANTELSELAKRLRHRKLYKTLDCRFFHSDSEWQLLRAKQIDKKFEPDGYRVIRDADARLTIYTQVGGDDEKAHKKLRILEADGKTPEITKLSPIVRAFADGLKLTRYYFADVKDRDEARALGGVK